MGEPMLKTIGYLKYAELEAVLRGFAQAYPDLCRLSSAGQSHQGRELWVLELTNQATGPAAEKPGYYLDGNHHAGEVTGSAVCLYTIDYLLANYGSCDQVTDLLDQTAFYVLPRVSPDGAELYLTSPYLLRSSVREWTFPEPTEWDGLQAGDIDGDGQILTMRLRDDELGDWKVSSRDARLLIKRGPNDRQGPFYRLFPEGRVADYDGYEIKPVPSKWGLDLNRNYPTHWRQSVPGSGPYPFSEPETRAVGDFLLAHPNIAGALSYHTSGGVILRPFCTGADTTMPAPDLQAIKAIGRRGEELTKYPCISIYEGFTRDKTRPSAGSFIDFAYDYLGILCFATELWDINAQAGLPKRNLQELLNLSEQQQEEDGLKLLQWNDQALAGAGFVNWHPFEHPELGAVELGGWLPKLVRQNPPLPLLAEECAKNLHFSLVHAASLPRLVIAAAELQPLAGDTYRVTAVVENAGYLPTSGSSLAERNKLAKPVTVSLQLPEGAELLSGRLLQELGHLPGHGSNASAVKRKVEWLLRLPQSGEVTVVAASPRAGTARRSISR